MNPEALLVPRREEDKKETLWATFNVVQENLTKGGVEGNKETKKGKKRKTRGLTNINRDLAVNQELWRLAEGIYVKKAA
jgi:hypothetical protein